MKPPYYYTMWSEYGVEHSPLSKLATVNKIASDPEAVKAWEEFYKDNPNEERAQFVVRNLHG